MSTIPRGILAVVFDLDGVLLDSAPSHRAAFEEVLAPLGIRDFDYSKYAGWRTAEVMEHVLRGAALQPDPELITGLGRAKSRIVREKLLAANPIAPDCLHVLQQLASQYILALASSGSGPSIEQFLNLNGCAHLFRSVLCGDDVGHAKPHPEIYWRTFDAIGIAPSACIVVEDAVSGIIAAKAAGAGGVIAVEGTCSAAKLTAAGASVVVRGLREIPEVLATADEHTAPN